MDLTVFGATGGVGGRLVRQSLAAGHSVTAVVRDASRLDATAQPGLRVAVVPDVTDAQALRPLVDGRDAVFSGLGPPGRTGVGIASAATAAILHAMTAAGVGRVLVVSAAPVGPVPPSDGLFHRAVATPLIRAVLKQGYADLALMEEELRHSGTDWTSVRPPRLTDGPLTGHYRTAVGGAPVNAWSISRADVAHAMLAAATDPATFKQPLGVAY